MIFVYRLGNKIIIAWGKGLKLCVWKYFLSNKISSILNSCQTHFFTSSVLRASYVYRPGSIQSRFEALFIFINTGINLRLESIWLDNIWKIFIHNSSFSPECSKVCMQKISMKSDTGQFYDPWLNRIFRGYKKARFWSQCFSIIVHCKVLKISLPLN